MTKKKPLPGGRPDPIIPTDRVIRPMTSKEYNRARDALGLNVMEMGRLIGVRGRQAQRYAWGSTDIAEPVAALVRLIVYTGWEPSRIMDVTAGKKK